MHRVDRLQQSVARVRAMRETTADAWVARLSTDLQTAGRLPELRLRAAAAALDRLCNSSNATAPFLNRVKRE